MAKEKTHINLVFIGHVDHGKSTSVGRLMFDAGAIDEATLRKLKEKADLFLFNQGVMGAYACGSIPFYCTSKEVLLWI